MSAELIERLETAEAGSRELDAMVEVAVRRVEAARTGLKREHWAKWRHSAPGLVGDGHTQYASAPVTTSLDAALALAERVLPGFHCHIGDLPVSDDADHEPHHKFGALLYDPAPYVRNRKDFMEHGATRALALVTAILKATGQPTEPASPSVGTEASAEVHQPTPSQGGGSRG